MSVTVARFSGTGTPRASDSSAAVSLWPTAEMNPWSRIWRACATLIFSKCTVATPSCSLSMLGENELRRYGVMVFVFLFEIFESSCPVSSFRTHQRGKSSADSEGFKVNPQPFQPEPSHGSRLQEDVDHRDHGAVPTAFAESPIDPTEARLLDHRLLLLNAAAAPNEGQLLRRELGRQLDGPPRATGPDVDDEAVEIRKSALKRIPLALNHGLDLILRPRALPLRKRPAPVGVLDDQGSAPVPLDWAVRKAIEGVIGDECDIRVHLVSGRFVTADEFCFFGRLNQRPCQIFAFANRRGVDQTFVCERSRAPFGGDTAAGRSSDRT